MKNRKGQEYKGQLISEISLVTKIALNSNKNCSTTCKLKTNTYTSDIISEILMSENKEVENVE